VTETLKQLDLPYRSDREPVLLSLHPYTFERHQLASLDVLGLVHLAIRPFPHLNQLVVRFLGRPRWRHWPDDLGKG
jgi:hypothetical protein